MMMSSVKIVVCVALLLGLLLASVPTVAASGTLTISVQEEEGTIVAAIGIGNNGSTNLTNIKVNVAITGPVSTNQTYFVSAIAPGTTHTLIVRYAPCKGGLYNITVSIPALGLSKSASVYYSPSQINIFYSGHLLQVLPETNGQFNVTLTFLGQNFTTLESRVVSTNYVNISAPAGTRYLSISSVPYPGLKRYIYFKNLTATKVLFPAQLDSSMYKVFNVYIFNKDDYDILSVYGDGGALIERINLTDFTNVVFPAVLGDTYTFELSKNGHVIYSQKVTATSSMQYITIYAPSLAIRGQQVIPRIYINATYDNVSKTVSFNLTSPTPLQGTLTVLVLSGGNMTPLASFNFTNQTIVTGSYQVGNAHLIKIEAMVGGKLYETAIAPVIPASKRPFSEELLPNGVLIIMIGGLGLFAATRSNIEVAAALTSLTLLASTYMGLISFPKTDLAIIYAMSSSMFLFNRRR